MLQFNEDTLPFFLGGKSTDIRKDGDASNVFQFDVPEGRPSTSGPSAWSSPTARRSRTASSSRVAR
ncbi:hypothetical protein SMICM17S_03409 [Streptomyces microflavus]